MARVLGLSRVTIKRKLLFLASVEQASFEKSNRLSPLAREVEFDELETFEHTKCKPVSVLLMVESKTRRILGFEVARMPAKGLLARISFKKYGFRKDERPAARRRFFERMRDLVHPEAIIRSDSNPHYPQDVRKYFPKAKHITVLGGRGAVTGQGELKKLGFDPIFSLNHTCAMFRARVSRLVRKTWNTTKRIDHLAAHLMIYAMSHNRRISTA